MTKVKIVVEGQYTKKGFKTYECDFATLDDAKAMYKVVTGEDAPEDTPTGITLINMNPTQRLKTECCYSIEVNDEIVKRTSLDTDRMPAYTVDMK